MCQVACGRKSSSEFGLLEFCRGVLMAVFSSIIQNLGVDCLNGDERYTWRFTSCCFHPSVSVKPQRFVLRKRVCSLVRRRGHCHLWQNRVRAEWRPKNWRVTNVWSFLPKHCNFIQLLPNQTWVTVRHCLQVRSCFAHKANGPTTFWIKINSVLSWPGDTNTHTHTQPKLQRHGKYQLICLYCYLMKQMKKHLHDMRRKRAPRLQVWLIYDMIRYMKRGVHETMGSSRWIFNHLRIDQPQTTSHSPYTVEMKQRSFYVSDLEGGNDSFFSWNAPSARPLYGCFSLRDF